MRVHEKVSELIGNTPIIHLKKLGNIFAKCEFLNPSHSIKDRAAFEMIKDALDDKRINQDTTIIEATSGNTGISTSSFNYRSVLIDSFII